MGFLHLILALTISWDCVTTDINGGPEEIDHYCVFFGEVSHDYANDNMVCAAFSNCYWILADDNFFYNTPYYFSVTAIDLAGNESDLSDEAVYLRQQPPFNGKIWDHRRKMYVPISPEDAARWHPQRMLYIPPKAPIRYRVKER